MKEFTSFQLFYPCILHYIIKELASIGVLHNQIQLLLSFDYLIELYDARMPYYFQDMNLSGNSLDICNVGNTIFLQDLYRNLIIRWKMDERIVH